MTDIHGGNTYDREIKYDFSANINPLGMPEGVRKAYHSAVDLCEKYPDHNCTELKKAIAEYEGVAEEFICVGNGAADLIFRIVHSFRPEKSLLVSPCFSEYEKALNETGCSISFFQLSEENNFELTENFADEITDDTDIIFLTSPNNPTGMIIRQEILKPVAEKCIETNTILVADECFMEFSEKGSEYSTKNFMNENIIILKAFTKIYAMAGIRLGYAVCGDRSKAEKISESGQYWGVSAIAQKCGEAALNEKAYIEKTRRIISAEKIYLETELKRLGFKVFQSFTDFIFFRAESCLYERLIHEGILIRNCGNYRGLSDRYFRIAVRTHSENAELINKMEMMVNG